MTKEIVQKVQIGDGLTNEELLIAIRFYNQLEDMLDIMGPVYTLAWREVRFRRVQLEQYGISRGIYQPDLPF